MDIAIAWSGDKHALEPPHAATYRSPGLELLADRIEQPRRQHLLDLGAPNGANVDFFGAHRCVIHVEDLFRSLLCDPALRGGEDDAPRDLDRIVHRALAHPPGVRFDAIVGWDLFDYMDEPTIRALMRRVSEGCGPGTLLFLLASNRDAVPAQPSRFTVLDRTRLAYEPSEAPLVPSPRHTPRALERMMPGFRLLHSFLLGDGMQDYLFTYG